jgi:hypothetical protein
MISFTDSDGMDWRAASRSRSRAPMEWRPASHSRSRSRPPLALGRGGMSVSFQMSSQLQSEEGNLGINQHGGAQLMAGQFGRTVPSLSHRDSSSWLRRNAQETTETVNEESPMADAPHSSAIAIPNASAQPLEGDDDDDEGRDPNDGLGSGPGNGSSSVSLLTKSLQMFTESPPAGPTAEMLHGHFSPTNAVGPHVTLTQTLKDRGINVDAPRRPSQPFIHQPLEQEAQQQQQALGGFGVDGNAFSSDMFAPSSLPAYHQQQFMFENHSHQPFPPSAQVEAEQAWQGGMRNPLNNGFPRRVRKTSFDHTVGRDGAEGDISVRGRHQVNGRPMEAPSDNTLVSISLSVCTSIHI